MRERNYGIEALRILATFFIVIVHILGRGGVLNASKNTSVYGISWFLYILAYSGVNCYALISGFVGFQTNNKEQKYSRYMMIWLKTSIYGVVITVILKILHLVDIGMGPILWAMFPISHNQYWYFTAYTALFFVIPFLNHLVANMDEKMAKRFLLVVIGLFSLYGTSVRPWCEDIFGLNGGYSFLWISTLYVVGAILKKYYYLVTQIKRRWLLLIIFVCCTFVWGYKMLGAKLLYKITGIAFSDDWFLGYSSPTIVLVSIALLLLFVRLQMRTTVKKYINFFASATFGVYVIHTQPLVYGQILKGKFSWIVLHNPLVALIEVIGFALLIFVMCSLIDKIYQWLFHVMKIGKILELIEEKIRKKIKII